MPIPLEKIRTLKHLVVHDACPDGTASAMILLHCLPGIDVQFVQYGTEAHRTIKVRPDTIFADFSPHPEQVSAFVKAGAIVLDHHRTQQQIVAEFGKLGIFGDEAIEPGVCGAVLVFREIWWPLMRASSRPGILRGIHERVIQDFAHLAGIRDTWQNKNPRWREACEQAVALDFWPWEYLNELAPDKWQEKLEIGPVLLQKRLNKAKRFGDGAWRFTSKTGTRVAVFEGIKMSSDVAEYLDDEVDLVIGFNVFLIDGEPAMVFSTRSHTNFDCGKFCKGGGGHTKAAGFELKLKPNDPQPFELARRILEKAESQDSVS